uniref:Uncharacterized protein n=1 Tax=Alexandrium monilatum TaxID=311494 RepID=A0A6T0RL79_9DINO
MEQISFSEVHKQVLGEWAPDGRHLAAVSQNRLLVRGGNSLKLVQVYVCLDKVERIEWSPDSEFLLTEIVGRSVVQVWSLNDADWACRIDEGAAGVARARWGTSSAHVLIVSDFQLYLKVWSLSDQGAVTQIRHPKYGNKGLSFSHDGCLLALLRRTQCQDSVAVFSCQESFRQVADISIGGDFSDLRWMPGNGAILLWERPSRSTRLVWYSPDGQLLGQVDEFKLLRSVFLSPSLEIAAVGGFDGSLHLVNGVTRAPLTKFTHDLKAACVETAESDVAVFREVFVGGGASPQDTDGANATVHAAARGGTVRYTRLPNPSSVQVPAERPGAEPAIDEDGLPRQGVGAAAWSPDERYIATKHDGMPTAVWVWDLGCLALVALLIHRTPVRSFSWDTCGGLHGGSPRLALTTAVDPLIFFWSPEEARVVSSPIPAPSLQWRCDGQALLLQDRQCACVCWAITPSTWHTAAAAEDGDEAAGARQGAARAKE